jgi:hypothetical protein
LADATVNVKLTPDEHRTIVFALDEAKRTITETVAHMSPRDGRQLRAMVVKIADLRDKL